VAGAVAADRATGAADLVGQAPVVAEGLDLVVREAMGLCTSR
jgi:hypothetical protein